MGRAKRGWYSQFRGSNHLISRITSGDFLLQREEKNTLLNLFMTMIGVFIF